ncbi:MAG: DUF1003 domain-containing protein [Ktedonobacteraceae bacterium]|nr:DUF1003 domain-containing protein [Ktedonobacteraceae bacterium]
METTPDASFADNVKHTLSQGHHLLDGMHVQFPHFKHEHHGSVIDVNKVADRQLTLGQRVADRVASAVGSWPFIIIQSIILAIWLVLNSIAWLSHWDPYPFILLNLALSFQAAYSAPFVMMSQNRQAEKDRLTAQNDYTTDCKGEEEVRHIMDHLDHQDNLILQVVERLQVQNQVIEKQDGQILQIVEQLREQNEYLQKQDKLILQVTERLEAQHQQLQEQRMELLKRLSSFAPEKIRNVIDETTTDTDGRSSD